MNLRLSYTTLNMLFQNTETAEVTVGQRHVEIFTFFIDVFENGPVSKQPCKTGIDIFLPQVELSVIYVVI